MKGSSLCRRAPQVRTLFKGIVALGFLFVSVTIAFPKLWQPSLQDEMARNMPQTAVTLPLCSGVEGSPLPSDGFEGVETLAGSYDAFFREMCDKVLGRFLARAVYDPGALSAAIQFPDRYLWRIPTSVHGKALTEFERRELISSLGKLKSFEGQVLFAKWATSVNIGRMHRDVDMTRLFNFVKENPALRLSLETAVRDMLLGNLRLLCRYIQLALFTSPTHYAHFRKLFKLRDFGEVDAVWSFVAELNHETTLESATTLFYQPNATWRCRRVRSPPPPIAGVSAVFDYDTPPNHDMSRQHYFMRPFLSCGDLVRTCESPEGCRFLCNPAYLLHAREKDFESQTGVQDRGKRLFHRVVGAGSNNQFDWEESLVHFFGYSAGERRSRNGIWTLSIVDCTVREFVVPPLLQRATVGFGYAKLCLGSKNEDRFVTYSRLKEQILASEGTGGLAHNFTRLQVDPVANAPPRGVIDDVSIFKVDIEGFEVDVIPDWAADEFSVLHTSPSLAEALRSDAHATIDFGTGAKALSVSQFQVEIHSHGSDWRSVHNWFHMRFLLSFLGFQQVVYEYNYESVHVCCYEAVFTHYKYFARSQVWNAMELGAD